MYRALNVVLVMFLLLAFGALPLQAQAPSGDPIRIGVVTELTGKAAMSGDHAKKGVELAREEINAAGGILGRPVELVFEDTQSTNPGAIAAYNKSVQEDNVVAVIAPIRSTQIQSMDPMIRESKIVTVMGGTNTGLTEKGNEWLFRFRPPDKYAGQAMVEYLVNDLKLTKVGILHDSDAFGSGGADVVEASLKEKGMPAVKREKYQTGDKDYAAQLLNIKNAGAEALVIYGTNSEDDAIIQRQRRELMSNVVVMGSPSNVAQVTFDLAGEATEGVYAVTDFLGTANPTAEKFVAGYNKAYNAQPDLYAAWLYDALYGLKYAMEAAGNTEAEPVRQAMLKLAGKESVEGTVDCAPNGDCAHTYYVVQAKAGKPELIKPIKFWPPVSATGEVTPTTTTQ